MEYKIEQGLGNTWHVYLYTEHEIKFIATVVGRDRAQILIDALQQKQLEESKVEACIDRA